MFRTAGERLCGRSLETEIVAGVPHYKEGQHHAAIIDGDPYPTALLSWVDPFGHAVAMPCAKRDGEWAPMGSARKAGQSMLFGVIPVPDCYAFNDLALEALKEAEEREFTHCPECGGRNGTNDQCEVCIEFRSIAAAEHEAVEREVNGGHRD